MSMHAVAAFLQQGLDVIGQLDLRFALVAVVLQLCNLVCRAVAWRNVLAAAYPAERVPVRGVGLAYAVGVGLNGWLPARGGEAAKIGLVRMQLPKTSLATIASSNGAMLLFDSALGLALLFGAWRTGVIDRLAIPSPAAIATMVEGHRGAVLLVIGALTVFAAVVVRARRRRDRKAHESGRLGRAFRNLARGLTVLRTPGRYLRTVVSVQALAWCCRIGMVWAMLMAFGIAAGPQMAMLVVVLGGLSTAVPVPGGVGTQQLLIVPVVAAVSSASTAMAFSVGLQVLATAVNSSIAIAAAMVLFGRLHPLHAMREALAAARHGGAVVVEHAQPVAAELLVPHVPQVASARAGSSGR